MKVRSFHITIPRNRIFAKFYFCCCCMHVLRLCSRVHALEQKLFTYIQTFSVISKKLLIRKKIVKTKQPKKVYLGYQRRSSSSIRSIHNHHIAIDILFKFIFAKIITNNLYLHRNSKAEEEEVEQNKYNNY